MDFYSEEYYQLRVYPHITVSDSEVRVITGQPAMIYCGLSVEYDVMPVVLTPHKDLDCLKLAGLVWYYYCDNIKPEYETHVSSFCNKILVPSQERAIVDCLRLSELPLDEGVFCDCLDRYQTNPDIPKLKEVALVLGVSWDVVDYWLRESYGFNNN